MCVIFVGGGGYKQHDSQDSNLCKGRGVLAFEKGQKQATEMVSFCVSTQPVPRKFHPLEKAHVCSAFMPSWWLMSLFMMLMCPIFSHLRGFFFFVSLSLHVNNIRAFLKAQHRVLLGCMSGTSGLHVFLNFRTALQLSLEPYLSCQKEEQVHNSRLFFSSVCAHRAGKVQTPGASNGSFQRH